VAVLQALLALISRSAGKILNAVFGWAVRALFGQCTSREQTFFSGVVAAAVAWPILVAGVAAPKVAALLLAFVPIPRWVPSWTVRIVWLSLAVLIPLVVGLAVASKAPPGSPRESMLGRTLRGYPITLGLAMAFLIMFVSVPVMRLVALVRRQKSADIPLVTDAAAYHQVAACVHDVLGRHGFALAAARPGWWVAAPTKILNWFGGEAFRAYVPKSLEHFVAPDLEVSLYPSGILLRGARRRLTWAHGLIAESIVYTGGLQTSAATAQKLERRLRELWKLSQTETRGDDLAGHADARDSLRQLDQLVDQLGTLDVEFEDWQALYRQILQLERTLRHQPQVLDRQRWAPPSSGHPDDQPDPVARLGSSAVG
jgi:hypothetical protein